ncbi:uncharacterized protein LOC129910368 [Episyrphus balteatus]|uniref:uncharacterized protein LOC129910368 n=1 Tax=Episyrphus balteatus TaxID=286459 RepID=UPI002485A656|nr:uncharacterized protein LOC129910368 [Episyrphus balteatus]
MRKFVIVLTQNTASMKQWIRYFADRKFTRIFSIVEQDSFAYLPYEDNQFQQLSTDDPLPYAQKNLRGFVFRTTVQKDIPRTFWYPDGNGKNQIGGTYGQIFLNFLRRHNATFKEIDVNNNSSKFDIQTVINATIYDEIDISMNVFCYIYTLDLSYPIKIEKYSIMVALNGYVDPKEYFQRPFSMEVWTFIGLTLTYVTIMDVILKYCTNLKVIIWDSFSQNFLTFLRMPLEKPIYSAYSMHIQVTILSFILGNIYVIYFTSFLTVHIKVKQYESIDDLIQNNIRVLANSYEWSLIEKKGYFPKGFDQIVEPIDHASYYDQLYSMRNTSYAFAVGSEKSEFLLRFQSLYKKPLFKLIDDVVKSYFLGFLLPFNSPFKEILNTFIIDVRETGLIEKWERDVFAKAIKAGFKIGMDQNDRGEKKQFDPLTMEHLRFAWNCLTIGLTGAVIVFLGERLIGELVRVSKLLKR